jgi:hypothetical protein
MTTTENTSHRYGIIRFSKIDPKESVLHSPKLQYKDSRFSPVLGNLSPGVSIKNALTKSTKIPLNLVKQPSITEATEEEKSPDFTHQAFKAKELDIKSDETLSDLALTPETFSF